ncbi:AAA family ATPase [Natrononativus amylolyticus]|uniref:AAA family ATPase n=1 Tax=Natrononativus amylolyticus TaxID=2963434 RepID=UPI0020CF307D|nr:AAA family ATPase [Natrononativus amylolyticus]
MNAHVELVGLPGSGKSTLSAMVRDAAARRDEAVYDDREAYTTAVLRAYLPRPAARFGKRVPPRAVRALSRWSGWRADTQLAFQTNYPRSHERTSELITEYATSRNRYNWLVKKTLELEAHYQSAQRRLRPTESVLFDEGFVHCGLSLTCPPRPRKPVSNADLESYLEAIPLPETCLFVTAPIDVCKRRMDRREKGRPGQYSHLADSEFDRFLERTDRTMETIRSILEETEVTVVEFDTGTELTETKRAVDEFVDSEVCDR